MNYKEYLLFNRNLLVSFAGALLASAIASQFLAQFAGAPPVANSLISLAVDNGVFFTIFGILFYRDNRYRFVNEYNKTDLRKLKWVLVKLASTLSLAEVEYNLVKPYVHFMLLDRSYEAYISSVIASMITFAGYIAVADLTAHYTKLLKK